MEKYFEEWNGKKFPVRLIQLPEELGGFETKVSGGDLWDAIENAYNDGDKTANYIDDSIYFYCERGFIESDPTDEEIVEYLIKNGC